MLPLILVALAAFQPTPHFVALKWNVVTKDSAGHTLTGTVYYNVYRDISGTLKYAKLNPSPIPCAAYFDDTVVAGTSYDYQVTAFTVTGGESGFSNKSGDVLIP
jgi:fibronectin type 3 domain-containing protein